MTKSRAVWS